MLAAAALATGFLEPLAALVTTGLQMQLTRSYMERINDVLDTPREHEGQTLNPLVASLGSCEPTRSRSRMDHLAQQW
jgi:ATP-binding cassette, subfamily B, bacterial